MQRIFTLALYGLFLYRYASGSPTGAPYGDVFSHGSDMVGQSGVSVMVFGQGFAARFYRAEWAQCGLIHRLRRSPLALHSTHTLLRVAALLQKRFVS